MKLSTLISKIMSGEIKDAKTIVAAMKLKELRNIADFVSLYVQQIIMQN